MYRSGNPAKHRVLLLAPAGLAASNIIGNTIHCDLHMQCQGNIFPLNDPHEAELMNKFF